MLKIPEKSHVEQAAISIPEKGGTIGLSRQKNYDRIAAALLERCASGSPLESSDIRDGAWCLWETKPALASTSALGAIIDGVEQATRKRPYRALASSFLASFDPSRPGMQAASEILARKAPEMGMPWARLQDTLSFFDLKQGPENVAHQAERAKISPTALLAQQGLGTLESESGYAQACAAALLQKLAKNLQMDPKDRLNLVRGIALRNLKQLIFADHAPLVANALVLPFGEALPEKATQDLYLQLLLGLFGDPRIEPGRWTRMREAEAIVKRWLIRVSLLQFLDVVDKVAVERMWVFRRAFWEAVYREDLIRDAWVVFDSAGAHVAKRSFGDDLPFARFRGGVQRGQAVLLLKVGRGIVAEWSHNGKCIIWSDAEMQEAPRIYQPDYPVHRLQHGSATDELRGPIFAVSHVRPHGYAWQHKVASKIHEMTGVMIHQSQYTVR